MSNTGDAITRARIAETEKLIRPFIRRTPLLPIDGSDVGLPPAPVLLKLELFQHSGSFKARGAFANLLLRKTNGAGVVAASGGNHGVAVQNYRRNQNAGYRSTRLTCIRSDGARQPHVELSPRRRLLDHECVN